MSETPTLEAPEVFTSQEASETRRWVTEYLESSKDGIKRELGDFEKGLEERWGSPASQEGHEIRMELERYVDQDRAALALLGGDRSPENAQLTACMLIRHSLRYDWFVEDKLGGERALGPVEGLTPQEEAAQEFAKELRQRASVVEEAFS